ncbi:MAG: acetylglutamate kinase [Muribaculaceae bacterium]|nr:acetylglutamate kinase [Muribaculaceae bacterium]
MIKIYKIGGNIINSEEDLRSFLYDFSLIPGKKILVHGGGKEATELSRKTGLEATMIQGRRVTDIETLKMVTMVYAGLINKRIVSILQEYQCNAVGLSGADGNVIPAVKRSPYPIDYGFVGDINPKDINTSFISLLLGNEFTPVFCAICRNHQGGLLNCNADTIAASLAQACSNIEQTDLIYCFEKKGVLEDLNDDDSLLKIITPQKFEYLLKTGKISEGMIPKITNALKAINEGVHTVRIRGSHNINKEESGTLICLEE